MRTPFQVADRLERIRLSCRDIHTPDGHYVTYQCFPSLSSKGLHASSAFPQVVWAGDMPCLRRQNDQKNQLKTHGHFRQVRGLQLKTHGRTWAA